MVSTTLQQDLIIVILEKNECEKMGKISRNHRPLYMLNCKKDPSVQPV